MSLRALGLVVKKATNLFEIGLVFQCFGVEDVDYGTALLLIVT